MPATRTKPEKEQTRRSVDEIRDELDKVLDEERALVEEARKLRSAEGLAIEDDDRRTLKRIAARQHELPLVLKSVLLKCTRLAAELAEAEHAAVEEERFEAYARVEPLREAEREAREARMRAEADAGNFQSMSYASREKMTSTRRAVETARQVDPTELMRRVTKGGSNQ
jgi:hypothetical protein